MKTFTRVFCNNTKLTMLASKAYLGEEKKSPKRLPPVQIEMLIPCLLV